MGFQAQKSVATAGELRLSTVFCKVNVIFWQNLMHYDTEKVLVSTKILLWGYFGELLFESCHCMYSIFYFHASKLKLNYF